MSFNPSQTRVVIAYKNFQAAAGNAVSHIGLGVAAINNVKWLQAVGVRAEVLPMKDAEDIRKFLNIQRSEGAPPVTHVVVSAPWVPTSMFSFLTQAFPTVMFSVNCHSNVGFLQADTNGIRLIREGLALESATYNFKMCGNSKRFQRFIFGAYGSPCTYLPNMYFLDGTTVHRPGWPVTRGTLRIGLFGATRTQKNLPVGVAAAIEVSRALKAQVEVWVNTQRDDGPETKRILRSVRAMVDGLPNITLKEAGWRSWPDFRKVVGNMHVCLFPSTSESFNMCAADAIAEGVPSVCSNAIPWLPHGWTANADDVFDFADVAVKLINDPLAAINGYRALRQHNVDGMRAWLDFLGADNSTRDLATQRMKALQFHDAGDMGL